MNLIFLKGYNNYFNRIVKKESTIADYKAAVLDGEILNYIELENINFNPNDGVTTELVVGKGDLKWDDHLPFSPYQPEGNYEPDYAVVYNNVVGIEIIVSRWFVTECVRTRGGQFKVKLKRDVIVDNLDSVIEAPIYLEKGYIKDTTNPLLYNKESLAVNQIKQYEVPLKDETKCGWIVGYIPNNWAGATVTKDVTIPVEADITVEGLNNWEYKDIIEWGAGHKAILNAQGRRIYAVKFKDESYLGSKKYYWRRSAMWRQYDTSGTGNENVYFTGAYSTTATQAYTDWAGLQWTGNRDMLSQQQGEYMVQYLKNNSTFDNLFNEYMCDYYDVRVGDKAYVMSLQGKTIYDSVANLYYTIRVRYDTPYQRSGKDSCVVTNDDIKGYNVLQYANNNIRKSGYTGGGLTGDVLNEGVYCFYEENFPYIVLEQANVSATVTIDTVRSHLEDAPYDMFCIPFSDTLQIYDGTDTFTCNKAVALSMATAIGEQAGSGAVYDVQLLPYCPVREIMARSPNADKIIDISSVSMDLITQQTTNTKLNAVIWATKSTFTFDIQTLDNIDYCNFYSPLSPISTNSTPKDKYLILNPDQLPETVSAGAIIYVQNTTSGMIKVNTIKLYQVDKATGKATYIDDVYTVDMGLVTQDMKYYFVASKYIGEQGHVSEEVVRVDFDTYKNADYYYMIYIDSSTGSLYEGSNVAALRGCFAYPNISYYDINLSDSLNAKLTNECNMYRLSAGNYSSIFEFSPAKSFGFDGYSVDCTYKPFQPWIHITPNLKGLYGEDFSVIDDARGLICGGDYSVTQLSNQWATYQLNNKTYQEMFDREIKNMDVNNEIARQEALVGAIAGSVTGAAGGATAGAAFGPWGAAIGGIVGGASSAVGGAVDYMNLEKRQDEAKSFKTDMYNYSIQNIKAIPSTLSKTSAFVYNTRVWPFLEVFTCTDIEKEVMKNKIKYDGMTVMAIGKLIDYLDPEGPHFWRGQLIRIEDLKSDSHVAEEIYRELEKGVYL